MRTTQLVRKVSTRGMIAIGEKYATDSGDDPRGGYASIS
jgi:hypothetical protein